MVPVTAVPEPSLAAVGEAEAGQGLAEQPRPAATRPDPPCCRFCGHSDVPLMATKAGVQCLDGIDCYGRQQNPAGGAS